MHRNDKELTNTFNVDQA